MFSPTRNLRCNLGWTRPRQISLNGFSTSLMPTALLLTSLLVASQNIAMASEPEGAAGATEANTTETIKNIAKVKVAPSGAKPANSPRKAGNYLVPPPPPYAPSILPEFTYGRGLNGTKKAEAESESPYSKYVYSKTGYEVKAKKSGPHVTLWSN